MKKFLFLILLAVPLLFTQNAFANFVNTYGLSASGIAQGNAVCAKVSDWSSAYYNMAGLGRTVDASSSRQSLNNKGVNNLLKENRENLKNKNGYHDEFAFNYLASVPILSLEGISPEVSDVNLYPAYALSHDYLNFGGINIGLVLDLNRFYKMPKSIISSCRFGLSAGLTHSFSSLNMNIVRMNAVDPRVHCLTRYGANIQMLAMHMGLGMGFLNDMFGVGLGMTSSAGGAGVIDMSDVKLQPDAQYPVTQTYLRMSAAPAIEAGAYFDPGKIWPVVKGLNFGVSYRMACMMDMHMDAGATMKVAGLAMPMKIHMLEYYTPHTISGGVSYVLPFDIPYVYDLTIELDFDCQLWSLMKISDGTMLNLKLDKDNNGDPLPLPEFSNVYSPKLGVSLGILDWLGAAAGYSFQTSMIPNKMLTGPYNYMDNQKHVASLGAFFIVPKMWGMVTPIKINLAAQFQFLVPRTAIKDAAYSSVTNPDYSYGGFVPSLSLEVAFQW